MVKIIKDKTSKELGQVNLFEAQTILVNESNKEDFFKKSGLKINRNFLFCNYIILTGTFQFFL